MEEIRGDHPNIIDYIKASYAMWIVFPPIKINRLTTKCICDKKEL